VQSAPSSQSINALSHTPATHVAGMHASADSHTTAEKLHAPATHSSLVHASASSHSDALVHGGLKLTFQLSIAAAIV
jgi:hypothetical protein